MSAINKFIILASITFGLLPTTSLADQIDQICRIIDTTDVPASLADEINRIKPQSIRECERTNPQSEIYSALSAVTQSSDGVCSFTETWIGEERKWPRIKFMIVGADSCPEQIWNNYSSVRNLSVNQFIEVAKFTSQMTGSVEGLESAVGWLVSKRNSDSFNKLQRRVRDHNAPRLSDVSRHNFLGIFPIYEIGLEDRSAVEGFTLRAIPWWGGGMKIIAISWWIS